MAHFAVILGIPFFFFQAYREHRAQQVDTSMRFIERSIDSDHSSLRASLAEPWEDIDVQAMRKQTGSEAGFDQAKLAVIADVPNREIEKLFDFYSTILICRQDGNCDRELIDKYFETKIVDFYCVYDGRIAQIGDRAGIPDYDKAMKQYANNCTKEATGR